MNDYSELKRLAEAATPGPWLTDEERQIFSPSAGEYVAVTEIEDFDPIPFKQGAMDASFIAAANPAAVLALIAENEALRKVANELRRFASCDHLHHDKPDQHEADEPCKVLARIDAAMSKEPKA